MDSELTALILLALSFPLMALLALILVIRQRSRIHLLEGRVARLDASHRAVLERLNALADRPTTPPPALAAAATGLAADALKATEIQERAAAPFDNAPTGDAANSLASPPAVPPASVAADPAQPPLVAGAPTGPERPTVPPSKTCDVQPSRDSVAKAAAKPKKSGGGDGRSFEEKLGARWSVWVGALALAIGGLMLVRFSIEQGYFGPAARVSMGALLGLGLIGAGEWMRRRDRAAGRALPADDRPLATPGASAALTAAGAACVFGATYAAYALYGFIGPAAAFVILGLVAVLTMFSAALQGPALAALGLPAALAAPLLVASEQPQLWPLVLYLAVTVGAAYALARLRRWRWLAVAAAVGAWLWGLAMMSAGYDTPLAASAHAVVQLALAAAALAIQPYLGAPDREARTDWLALLALIGFAALGLGCLDLHLSVAGRVLIGAALIAVLLGSSLAAAAVAGASLVAGAVTAGALWNWPVLRLSRAETSALAPGGVGAAPMPENLTLYLAFAVVATCAVSAPALRRLVQGRDLPLPAAASYAAAAALAPLGALAVVWMKTAHFAISIPFALVAALLAGLGVALVSRLRSGPEAEAPQRKLAAGAIASAAVAAIALGLTFALDKGMLTVAFALMAPAVAWIALRMELPALRCAVGGIGVLLLGRIIANPAIAAEGAIGATPVFNWLLWGYGVPALAFAAAAWLLARQGRDRITALCESLAIIFAVLLTVFEIRHALNNGAPFAIRSGHLESGLIAVSGLLFSMALSRLNLRRADPVYRIGALVLALGSFAVIIFGLILGNNPLITGEPISGGVLFNSLLPAYLAPAVIAGLLAMGNRAIWPRWRTLATAVLALALFSLWAVMQIRRYFEGPVIAMDLGASDAEWLSYTVASLVIGVVLLAWGLLQRRQIIRQASAFFIIVAVLKAFLSDMAGLDGVWRALSFIGLGLVLIGVARAYQLLLFPPGARPGAPPAGDDGDGASGAA